jgi:DNA primase
MRITQEVIETIKRADLRAVIESHGVRLKRRGTNFTGLCPFHEEKEPSFTVNPKTNLWHCFGCDSGGDVIKFLMKTEGIGFREAVARLSGNGGKAPLAPSLSTDTPGVAHDQSNSKVFATAKERGGRAVPSAPLPSPLKPTSSLNRSRLLNRVVSFYHQSFTDDPRALEYLKARGITDHAICTDFQVGFANGTMLNTIPPACASHADRDDGDIREGLREIGILNERGRELFYGCVVFPVFDENKDCVGLYGRRITDLPAPRPSRQAGGETSHLYLPGPRHGVFNFQAAKRSKSLILTESVIDALTLYNAGFRDVVPCWGVNGLTEDHLALLARCLTREVYLCFDRDEAGEQGAERIAERLREKGTEAHIVRLPVLTADDLPAGQAGKTDVNSFFLGNSDAPVIFEQLLKEANPRCATRSDKVVKLERRHYEKTESGFVVHYGERRYEVRGIAREGVKLRATVKAMPAGRQAVSHGEGKAKDRFHLDTVDLYSNRSRLLFAKACASLFAEKEELVVEDITKLIELGESWEPEKGSTVPLMNRSEEEEALEFLKDTSLFNRLLSDFETIGLTGEEGNKLMGYLAATSRKLDEPLSILIQSRSAAGKSTLQDAVLLLMPPEDQVKYTRLTGQALFYKEETSLVHKVLAIEEETGARDASYSIRNIQSSKYLSIAATGKDPVTGKLRTEEYRVQGPVALMITTTEVELDYETSNRFVTLTIDESREMTERILKKQRERETLGGLVGKAETERVMKRHHNAQRLLRPLAVINPFAEHLTFPSESLRARRDHKKYLGLIKAIAFLRQYRRAVKAVEHKGEVIEYIEVTLDDIEQANSLAGEVLGRSLDELSPPSRALLKMIREMVEARCAEQGIKPEEYRFSRKDIRDWSRWSDFQVKCHIKQLEDLEYLYSVAGKKGKEYVYELLYPGGGEDGKPVLPGLTSIERLREKINLEGKRPNLEG